MADSSILLEIVRISNIAGNTAGNVAENIASNIASNIDTGPICHHHNHYHHNHHHQNPSPIPRFGAVMAVVAVVVPTYSGRWWGGANFPYGVNLDTSDTMLCLDVPV